MKRLWETFKRSYWNALREKPYSTNVAQAAVFMAVGDVLAQLPDRRERSYDVSRTAKMAGVGAAFGPFLVLYYRCLDRVSSTQGTQLRRNIVKISVDQLVMAPVGIIAFVALMSAAEGKDVGKSLENQTVGLMMDNYKVWPAAQVINFTLVPSPLRAGFHQIVALGWNSYVNWKLHSQGEIENKLIPLNYGNKGYLGKDDS